MKLLQWLDEHSVTSQAEAAAAVGVSVAEIEILFDHLVTAGLVEPAVEH